MVYLKIQNNCEYGIWKMMKSFTRVFSWKLKNTNKQNK
jgi:hypothetical protein